MSPTVNQPKDLRALFDDVKAEMSYSLNCHMLGQIVAYNPATGKSSVRLSTLRVLGDKEVPYPILTDCPTFVMAGGRSAYFTVPIQPGDHCLVLFHDRDIDNWDLTGGTVPANTARAHDLSDGLVLVGFRPAASPLIPAPSATDTVMRNGIGKIAIDTSGKIDISNNFAGMLDAVNTLCTALTTWVDTNGDAPNPATVTAITAAKTKFNNLLK
jgi:hypothetical protein